MGEGSAGESLQRKAGVTLMVSSEPQVEAKDAIFSFLQDLVTKCNSIHQGGAGHPPQ